MNWLERLHLEMRELKEKLDKLLDFIDTQPYYALDEEVKFLLVRQAEVMREYYDILKERSGDEIKDK